MHRFHVEAGESQSDPGVPQDLHFDVAISFGYPLHDDEHPSAPNPGGRKPFDAVVFWERWDGGASGAG